MAYGLYLYKEIESKSGKTIRLEIFQKDYSGSSIEIESMSGVPLTLVSDNANGGVYLPIVKSFLNINIIDTEQIDYSVFFTPDATKFKVLLKVNGTLEWSGYLTPDSFSQSLQYKSEINLVARDNLGMLSEFDFDLTNTFYSISTLINTALTRIGFQFTLETRTTKVDSANETIVNGLTQSKFWVGKNWQEVLETILTGIGCQLRYVGGNKYAIFDIGNLSSLGTTEIAQPFVFIEQTGIQEIVPAWKVITINQDYGKGDNSYDGFIEEATFEFDSNKGGDENNPYNFYTRPYYTISLSNDWVSTIPMLNPYEYPNLDPNDIYITGKSPATTLFMGQDLTYGKYFEAINDGKAIQFKFKASNYPYYITRRRSGEYMVEPMLRARYLYEMKVRCNLFAQTATEKYVLQGRNWIIWTNEYSDALEFTLPQTKESGVFGKKGTELTSQMDSPQEQDITIEAYGLGVNARVYIEFYPYTATYTEVDGLGNVDDYPAIVYDVHTMKLSSFEVRIVENEFGGLETKATLNADHNINGGIELALGQVPRGLGGYNTYLGGIFKNSNPYYPPMYDFHFTGGINYTLSELVGREIAHHYKAQRKKLSGNIINSDNFAAMPSFAKPFYDGSKYYALNYGSLDFRSEVMSVELIEVEDYETEDYTFVEATIDTGGSSLGSGETEFIQWSAAGNAKRIYELDTASEADTAGSFAVIDKSGMSSAKKVPLFTLLDQKENLLPATPSDPEQKFLNGNKEWSLINLGSGGNSPKVFFTSIASDVATYKELSYTPEATTSYCTASISNAEVLCSTFLYPLGVGVESLDAGTWEFEFFAKVSGTAGSLTMKAEVFKRDIYGVETTLFSKYSDVINNTTYKFIPIPYTSVAIPVSATDRIGVRVYGKNTIAAAITLSWAIGDGDASYFVTPLNMRHAQLRGKNDEAGFQHITEGSQTFAGAKTFSDNVTALELISTRLRIPTGTPSGLTLDKWYLFASETGFSGETPSEGAITDLYSLTDVVLTGITSSLPAGQMLLTNGTKWANVAASTTNISEGTNLYFTTARVKSYADTLYLAQSLKGSVNGLAELDANGFVKNTQLPSYVDDVIEVANYASLPVTGESGKIYITIDDNKTYRWSGSTYAEISASLALGETSSTAYRGDRGKIAYDHTFLTNNPHSVTATQVGLGNVLNVASYSKTESDAKYAVIAQTFYIGTTQVAINRASGALSLTGVSIDGNSGTATALQTTRTIWGQNFNGSGNVSGALSGATTGEFSGNVTMAENINTRLRIPTGTPSGLTQDKWYLFADATGFGGEVPSGGAITDMYSLTDTQFSAVMPSAGKMIRSNGTKWVDVTPTTAMITEDTNLYYTNARVQSFGDTRYALASSLSNYYTKTDINGFFYSDTRTITPQTWGVQTLQFGFTSMDLVNGSPYADYLRFGGYPDSSGGRKNIILFAKGNFGIRQYQGNFGASTYDFGYVDYWHTGNFTPSNYSLTSHTHDDRYYTETEIGNFFSGSVGITGYNKSNWDTAYSYSQVGHLPLSGGTLTGNLIIYSGSGGYPLLALVSSTGNTFRTILADGYTYLQAKGISNNQGTILFTGLNGEAIGGLKVTTNTGTHDIIHSGNIGSQSVNYAASAGNADTLDNQHASYFATAAQLNASNLSSGYLPYWNGSSLVNSIISQNGNVISVAGEVKSTLGAHFGTVGNSNTLSAILGGYGISDGSVRYGDYGQLLFNASSAWTAGARKWLITNAYQATKFAIIRGVDSLTNPSLGINGEVGSGTVDFSISNIGNIGIGYTDRTEKFAVNGSGYFNTTLQVVGNITMAENINTRLRIPKLSGTPTGLTNNEYYLFIQT